MTRRTVAFVQAWVSQYRRPFYDGLRARLDEAGVELVLVYGSPRGDEAARGDAVDVPWGMVCDNRVVRVAGKELWWQPALARVRNADLVVVEQASKRLVNYLLLARQAFGRGRVAFWGHGRNFQPSTRSAVGEWVKRRVSRLPAWWFPYNDLSARIVAELGFPRERITVVDNAIDTHALTAALAELPAGAVASLRADLGICGDHVALYCGALYPDKRLQFLLEAAEAARQRLPDLALVVVGDGVSRPVVEAAAAGRRWVHAVGPRFGPARVPYFALARALLLPGAAGLAVLDAFALETPVVTSRSSDAHGPEIAYVEDGVNGLVVDDGGHPGTYGEAIVRALTDEALHARLVAGCRASRERYTMERMIERFATGILAALDT